MREADLSAALDKPQGIRASSSGQQPAVVMTAADAEAAAAPRRPPSGAFELSDPADDGAGGSRLSGLDLAVSPEAVRKASQHKMQAVNLQQLQEAAGSGSPASRSGQYRALSPAKAEVRSTGALPTSAATPEAAQPKPAAVPAEPGPHRKYVLPVALVVVGLVMVIGFYINASMGGGKWSIGPVPINWIAGILVVAGTGLLLVRVFLRED